MNVSELHALFLKFPEVSTDTRKITENVIFFALKGESFNGNTYAAQAIEKGAAYAIIDEEEFKKNEKFIVVPNVLASLQELATYHRNQSAAKVIALTGSNGKTTTKELVYTVLSKKYATIATKGNLNNHIGVPLTLLTIKETTEIAVVEMGANHQKEIAFLSSIAQPDFGYITNFGKAHLEGFGGVEGVIKGKSELYDYLLKHEKTVFLNADDPIQLKKLAHYTPSFGFSATPSEHYQVAFVDADPFVKLKVDQQTISSQLIGSYNYTNCAAAVLMGHYFNVPLPDIKSAIENYRPENNRSQIIKKNGHHIILDAYNANPTSMRAALQNFNALSGSHKVVFLGDMFELGGAAQEEHQAIVDMVTQLPIESVYLVGENFAQTKTEENTFHTFELVSTNIKEKPIAKNSTILIKGSRGMALERLLELL